MSNPLSLTDMRKKHSTPKKLINILSTNLFQFLAVVGNPTLLQKRFYLEGEWDNDFREANFVSYCVQILEHAAVHLLHDSIFEPVFDQLRLGDLEAAAEVKRLHRKFWSLFVEIVLINDVKIVRQNRNKLLGLAWNSDELWAKVKPERVILRSVDQSDCAADNLKVK